MELDKIAAALVKAQAEFQNPSFDSQNPHFRSKFASLKAVRSAVIPVFTKHGIFVSQELTSTERGVACSTILLHTSGQQIKYAPLEMPATKQDAQGYGSAATYARRYSLMSVAGVVGDDDDDANAAIGKPAEAESIPQVKVTRAIDEVRAALAMDVSEEEKAHNVRQWHERANRNHDFYMLVWEQLGSKERSAIKTYTEQGAPKATVAANGRRMTA